MAVKISISGGVINNQGGTIFRADKELDVDIQMDNVDVKNESSGEYRAVFYETKSSKHWTEQLGLPNHANPQELYDLLKILQVNYPQDHSQIIKESKFFTTLSVAADATAVIPIIIGLAINPNIHQIMHSLYKLATGSV